MVFAGGRGVHGFWDVVVIGHLALPFRFFQVDEQQMVGRIRGNRRTTKTTPRQNSVSWQDAQE